MDAVVGTVVLDRYRVEAELGAGGMGRVYLARHIHLGTKVALKLLAHDEDPLAEERFHREAELMARVRHPNVVAVVDFGMTIEAMPAIVMEFVEGHLAGGAPPAPRRHGLGRRVRAAPGRARGPRRRCTPRPSCTATSSRRT